MYKGINNIITCTCVWHTCFMRRFNSRVMYHMNDIHPLCCHNISEEEEEKEPEPEWEPYIPSEPSPILTGFYSEPGKFWLSMVTLV